MSLRLLSFLVVAVLTSAAYAAPALAGPGGWHPQIQVQLALPLPGPVAYAPPPAPLRPAVYLHAAAPPVAYTARPVAYLPPPAAYAAPPPPPAAAQQWVWVQGGWVVQSCGARAWAPAHWELRTVAPPAYSYGHGHRQRHGRGYADGPVYATAYGPHHPGRWQR